MASRSGEILCAAERDAIRRRRKALKLCHGDHRAARAYLKSAGYGPHGRPLDPNGVEHEQNRS